MEKNTPKTDFLEIQKVSLPITSVNVLSWLKANQGPYSYYYSSSCGEFELAATGCLTNAVYENSEDLLGLRVLAVAPFDGNPLFYLPRFELCREGNNYTFHCYTHCDEDNGKIFSLIDAMDAEGESLNRDSLEAKSFTDVESYRDYTQMVEKAQEQMRSGDFDKIVLARRLRVDFAEDPCPFSLLASLKEKTKACSHFLFSRDGEEYFLSATPEKLLKRKGEQVFTEALAGTEKRSLFPEEDRELGRKLLASEKESREHGIVSEYIEKVLGNFCSDLKKEERIILKRPHWQHIHQGFQGTLLKGISLQSLLSSLHPTPAVGIAGENVDLSSVRDLENFDRGYYAGYIGWETCEAAEFFVAIRSAILYRNSLTIFSGAGIVPDSQAEKEWEETRTKSQQFVEAVVKNG